MLYILYVCMYNVIIALLVYLFSDLYSSLCKPYKGHHPKTVERKSFTKEKPYIMH